MSGDLFEAWRILIGEGFRHSCGSSDFSPAIYDSQRTHMADTETLRQARQSFEQKAWADCYRLFEAAARDIALDPEDLERLATTAYLTGRDDEGEAFRERAHQAFLARGDHESAARSAFWLAFELQQRRAGCRFGLVREGRTHS